MTQASALDQVALGAHMIEGRATDEFYRDREFSLDTSFLQFSVATDLSRSSIATENPGTWDFSMMRHRAYIATVDN